MDIAVQLAFNEDAALRLLNWLADENALILTMYDQRAARTGEPSLPGIYESGVRYEREKGEIWGDVLNTYMNGIEDCDALAAIRSGELMARGWRALRPDWRTLQAQGYQLSQDAPVRYPGDEGYALAMQVRPEKIYSEVYLKTNADHGKPGLYHCVTRYFITDPRTGIEYEFHDDPSARLGMLGGSAESQQGLAGGSRLGRMKMEWETAMAGSPLSMATDAARTYNRMLTKVSRKLYPHVRPYIPDHPALRPITERADRETGLKGSYPRGGCCG